MAYYIRRGIARHFSHCFKYVWLVDICFLSLARSSCLPNPKLSAQRVYLTHNCTFSVAVAAVPLTGTFSLSARIAIHFSISLGGGMSAFYFFSTRDLACSLLSPGKYFGHHYTTLPIKLFLLSCYTFRLLQNLANWEYGIYLFPGTHFFRHISSVHK